MTASSRAPRSAVPLRVVNDQEVSTTYARPGAALVALVEAGGRGIFHGVNEGRARGTLLAVESAEASGPPRPVAALTSEELAAPARRPRYSALSTERYRSRGLPPLREWRAALADHLANV